MRKILFILPALALLAITSCQKVINIKVSDTEPKLVIEAKYDAVKEEVLVHISQTANVLTKDTVPYISGAMVKIIDTNGVETLLSEIGNGTYFLDNYSPIHNSTYKMEVRIDGITYSSSDLLVPIIPMDSMSYEFQEKNLFLEEGYMVTFHFTDPFDENFYRVFQTINGEEMTEVGEQMMLTDGFSNGLSRSVPLYWKTFEIGDTIKVDFASYSKQTYRYYSDLFAALQGTEMSAAPTNPKQLWKNDTGDKIEVLGHFTAFGYDTKQVIIGE